jgi:hypothetical protein
VRAKCSGGLYARLCFLAGVNPAATVLYNIALKKIVLAERFIPSRKIGIIKKETKEEGL